MGFSTLPRNSFSPNSSGAEWGSQFFQETGFVPSSFLGWLGFRGLSPYFSGILFHHHFLVPARVPGLVSLLFWHPVPLRFRGLSPYSFGIILSWFRLGFRGLSHYSFGILFHHPFLVRLGFRGLSPYFSGILFHHPFLVPARVPGLASLYSFGILFHHPFLVPARVPGLVSLLFWHPVPSSFLVPARVPGLVSLYSFGILFHHHFMVPAGVPGLVAQTALELNGVLNSSKKQFCSTMIFWFRVFWHSVPSSFPQSFWFRVGFRGLSP